MAQCLISTTVFLRCTYSRLVAAFPGSYGRSFGSLVVLSLELAFLGMPVFAV